jgi:hypothetical protein
MAQHDLIARRALPRTAAMVACCLLSACSTSVELRQHAVSVPEKAVLGRSGAAVFVDRVVLPPMRKGRIGAVYTPAHVHLRYITTDQDIAKWLQSEWYAFLARHGNRPVEDIRQADYSIDCRIETLRVESIYHYVDPEQFHAVIDMEMEITDRHTGAVVFDRRWQTHYSTDRTAVGEMPDQEVYGLCLSMVVQKALEQIHLASGANGP